VILLDAPGDGDVARLREKENEIAVDDARFIDAPNRQPSVGPRGAHRSGDNASSTMRLAVDCRLSTSTAQSQSIAPRRAAPNDLHSLSRDRRCAGQFATPGSPDTAAPQPTAICLWLRIHTATLSSSL